MTDQEVIRIHQYIDEFKKIRRRHRRWRLGLSTPVKPRLTTRTAFDLKPTKPRRNTFDLGRLSSALAEHGASS